MRLTDFGLRARGRREDGFTMLLALGVMLVTMLLVAAVFTAVQGDASLSRGDLDGKRAYSAAQAGLQAYLGELNENASSSAWWETCANDSATNVAVPGTTGETYSYQPVVSGCATTGAISTVVDPTVGLLRMEFTGRAGRYGAQRTIVADFRPLTPLAYLWYTVHETVDPQVLPGCPSLTSDYANSSVPKGCWIYWASGDQLNGPMYTKDQFLVAQGSTPYFGRTGSADSIASYGNDNVCVVDQGGGQPVPAACPPGVVRGKLTPDAGRVDIPADNSNLATDANSSHGIMLPFGTTTLTLRTVGGLTNATAVTCTSASICATTLYTDLAKTPVIYAPSVNGSCAPSYTPTNVTYQLATGGTGASGPFQGTCGDIYVQGTYNTSLTIAAQNNIVVTGNLENSTDSNGATLPTGAATLGLVANQYVRVYHAVTRTYNSSGVQTGCSGAASPLTIDAAILTLDHSFYVDNYDCGTTATLTIHGSLAQQYRGAVGMSGTSGQTGQTGPTGYVKNYVYDDRLKIILPAYMFDLQNTSWDVVRETLCSQGQPGTAQGCT